MQPVPDDEKFMRRAIRLAMNGRGRVEPNPMVGSVIVATDGQVIGEGYHEQFGGPHAEPNALASCRTSPAGATAYVTLEPCCHLDKKTPPCAPKLIEARIRRVVVGCLDPNPQVNGGGVAMLRAAGVEVDAPVLESECLQLIAPFIASVKHRRPYITAKWAQSANGQVAGPMGRPARITNATSDRRVHELRARCDAIAVGTNTVLSDDPLLTARGVERRRPLLRVVLSNSLKIPTSSRLVASARQHPLVVYSSQAAANSREGVVSDLTHAGAEVVALPTREETRFSFADVLADLHQRGVTHLLVEPGPTLCRYLLSRGQVDRVWVFHSPRVIEDAGTFAVSAAPRVEYPESGRAELDGDTLIEYLNPASDVFFANAPSTDLVLSQP
jgi:diaminohydroxyphosphoribosylaminopyrimidine deaminase/5-amino-6-(5-phosphoribosylamino)uracil reductase